MKNVNLSRLGGKKDVINKSHVEFISASSTHGILSQQQQRQASKILNQVQDDLIIKAKGFTLVELLVVVLIIGILAAVAVPQYQKAVDKTRYTQAMVLVESMWQAEEQYKMENGSYSLSFGDLDIGMPTPIRVDPPGDRENYHYSWGDCFIHNTGYLTCKVNIGSGSAWYFAVPGNLGRECWAQPKANARANALCRAVTKKTSGTPNGDYYVRYKF